MKRSNMILMTAAVVLAQFFAQQTGCAQQMYKAFVNAIVISTNGSGLSYQKFGTANFITNCATEAGVTNLSGLSLVYDLTNDALEVISGTGTNMTVVCTPLTFSDNTSLSSADGTRVERLAWVTFETSSNASGTLSATEKIGLDSSNNITSFKLIGQLAYSTSGDSNSSPSIVRGNLIVGAPFFCGGHHHRGGEGEGGDDQGGDSQGGNSQGGDRHHGGDGQGDDD